MATHHDKHTADDTGGNMNIIKRYIHDVTRRLPEKQRADVAKELAAEIEDMVETKANGKRPTKKHAYDVLLGMGSPSALADQYRDHPRYLIGPEYYESYITLLKTIYIIVLPIFLFITWMTESLTQNHTPGSIFLSLAGMSVELSVHLFFWSTLSFIFAQKVAGMKPQDENWTPDSLPKLPADQEITRSESYFGIAWSVVAILATLHQFPYIYNWFAPDSIPQFFAPGMWPSWTFGLFAISLLGLGIEIVKMIIGGWTKITVMGIWLVNSLAVAYFISVAFFVYPIANPDLLQIIAESLGRPDITQSVHSGIIVFIIIVILINLWEMAESLYKYKKGGK